LKDQLTDLKKEKESLENEWKTRMENQKEESQRLVEEYKQKAYNAESEAKDKERAVLQAESEFDKQSALKD